MHDLSPETSPVSHGETNRWNCPPDRPDTNLRTPGADNDYRRSMLRKTTNPYDRRTFTKWVVGLTGTSVLTGFAGCTQGGEAIGEAEDGEGDNGTASAGGNLDLREGTRIGLGSTAFAGLAGPSEINPDEPGGGRLVTVDAVDQGEKVTISWRQTVEREVTPETPPSVGVGEDTPTPEVEVIKESGTITATGLASAHQPYLPMYWKTGEVTTDTSAIWLSQEAFHELRENRQTVWSRDVLTRISRLGEEALNRIEEGVAEVDQVYLNAEADFVEFELEIDGQSTSVRAIKAYDTFGNAYRILDNQDNPLILKFTYDAVSTGFAGIDAGLWSLIKTVFSGYRIATIATS